MLAVAASLALKALPAIAGSVFGWLWRHWFGPNPVAPVASLAAAQTVAKQTDANKTADLIAKDGL